MSDQGMLIAQGEVARQLLEDPVMQEAFDRVEQRFVRSWRETELKDAQHREMLWAQVKGLEEVRRSLRAIFQRGQHAALTQERQG